MVRNRKGGSKHKKQSRKDAGTFASYNIKTRLKDPKEDAEIYAIVSSMYGQGNCEVLCNDRTKRLCVIRNKFRGRNKWSNNVTIGSYVLVGLRPWEVLADGKKEKCDLLEVYTGKQIDEIKKDTNFNALILRSQDDIEKDRREASGGGGAAASGSKSYIFRDDTGINEIIATSKKEAAKTSSTLPHEKHTEFEELEDLDIDGI